MSNFSKDYHLYLTVKEDLTDKQRDDYLKNFIKQGSKKLMNMIELINNS